MTSYKTIKSKIKSIAGDNKSLRPILQFTEACKYHDWRIWNKKAGNCTIRDALVSGKPQAIGKIGSVELQNLRSYLRHCHKHGWQDATAIYRKDLYTNAGVFPEQPQIFERYCEFMMEEILPEITVIGVWHNYGEAGIIKKFAPNAAKVPMRSLESYYISNNRWTAALEGKTVLVLHPFVETIRKQYEARNEIWKEKKDILPDFNLVQIKVPQLPALDAPCYPDWFSSLEAMRLKMNIVDFDIALIGAGAYSLPLAVHAKKLGKNGIHLGGATQIYFGIKGGRWDHHPVISKFYNTHWVRPLSQDTPNNREIVENGCYW